MRGEGGLSREVKEGTGGTERGMRGGRWECEGGRGWLCVSRGPPRELCSREPGHWGEVVRACLKQYTQGFSQSSHTQCARSMSLSQRSPAQHQHIQSNTEKLKCIIAHAHAQRRAQRHRQTRARSANIRETQNAGSHLQLG